MNRGEHLSEKQLSDYFGALNSKTKHEIGRHLLKCDFCLKRLPPPSPEQFIAALMTENDVEDIRQERMSLAAKMKFIARLLKQSKIWVLSASTLAVVLFFSAFIWFSVAKSSEMEREVAENLQPASSVFGRSSDEKIKEPSALLNDEKLNRRETSPNRIASEKSLSAASSDSSKQDSRIAPQKNLNAKTKAKLPGNRSINISTTRGGNSPKCSDQPPLELTAETNDEGVVLKWKKIREAAKYHLYVSDDDEILVDEFETERETSYVLKKPLDPLKTYNLKVIATLAGGEMIIGDSQKFTIKNLQHTVDVQKKSQRKKKSEIRCTE